MKTIHETYSLSNGVKIPKVGFGTAPLKGDEAYQAVKNALSSGYRHIDTAEIYLNQKEVGEAIKESGIDRKTLFVTSKLDSRIKSYEDALKAFNTTLELLQLDYLDLYLIHAPWPWDDIGSNHDEGNVQAFKALEKLYKEDKIKAIGVSNFSPKDLDNILNNCEITPHVNQIKYHVGHTQEDTLSYCKTHNILIEAYSPLGRGSLVEHPTIRKIAKEHQVSTTQVLLKYCIEKSVLPLPRSKNPKHIKTNSELDFKLNSSAIKELDNLTV